MNIVSNSGLSRRDLLAAGAAALPLLAVPHVLAEEPPTKRTSMGVVIHSYPARQSQKPNRFSEPLVFLEHCRSIGAGGVQLNIGQRDEAYAAQLREAAAKAGMYLEGSISLPKGAADVDRFTAELRTAKACGVTIVRSALLGSRRYETFDSADAFAKFASASWESLALAKPVVEREQLKIAVENHKDWRVSELVALLKRLDSPQFGVCVDTGNSIALVEDPLAVVEAYAPLAFTTHIKDMGVEEYPSGFRLAEVPFGKGFLDLPKIVEMLRRANPAIRFNLEMITRDPLDIPCLTPKYWATMSGVPATELAASLALVRKHALREPLPRTTGLSPEERIRKEEENVQACLAFAREKLGLA
jgi:sugar phosphate isomerase/epimerase